MQQVLVRTITSLYILSVFAYFLFFVTQNKKLGTTGFFLGVSGFVFHCALLVWRGVLLRHFPVSGLYESLVFFAWLVLAVYLATEVRLRQGTNGVFIMPLVVSLMAYAASLDSSRRPLAPALQSPWLSVHVTLCFLGYACFTLAFAFAVMYLWQERGLKTKKIDAFFFRLPPIEFLDRLGYRSIAFGFIFLTLGIISGSVWAQNAWGRFWNWDPKETWSLVTWLVYLAYLHGRLALGFRGAKCAVVAIAGFGAMLFTYFGVSFLLPGLHSYLK
ncbi:MAG: c-type cytochrome biogenesis protein CcsB [Candidatus Omnitrophica bacterium]|nr:c-type cytochrome biogenesis protein CcsB [Candidatus Omnitrophota bacterium]